MASDIPFPATPRVGARCPGAETPDVGTLFHQLNNQLGIILANAELLEARLGNGTGAARAGHIVSSVVEAIALARNIRGQTVRGG